MALTPKYTGSIRPSPNLADTLARLPGLVSQDDIEADCADGAQVCERPYVFGLARAKEVHVCVAFTAIPLNPSCRSLRRKARSASIERSLTRSCTGCPMRDGARAR